MAISKEELREQLLSGNTSAMDDQGYSYSGGGGTHTKVYADKHKDSIVKLAVGSNFFDGMVSTISEDYWVFDKGQELTLLPYKRHNNIGANGKGSCVCLSSIGEYCPICEGVMTIRNSNPYPQYTDENSAWWNEHVKKHFNRGKPQVSDRTLISVVNRTENDSHKGDTMVLDSSNFMVKDPLDKKDATTRGGVKYKWFDPRANKSISISGEEDPIFKVKWDVATTDDRQDVMTPEEKATAIPLNEVLHFHTKEELEVVAQEMVEACLSGGSSKTPQGRERKPKVEEANETSGNEHFVNSTEDIDEVPFSEGVATSTGGITPEQVIDMCANMEEIDNVLVKYPDWDAQDVFVADYHNKAKLASSFGADTPEFKKFKTDVLTSINRKIG